MEELLAKLLKQNEELTKQIIELSKAIVHLTAPQVREYPIPAPFEPMRLFQSEEEQDAQWMYDNGLIDQHELKGIFEQAEFDNTSAVLDR